MRVLEETRRLAALEKEQAATEEMKKISKDVFDTAQENFNKAQTTFHDASGDMPGGASMVPFLLPSFVTKPNRVYAHFEKQWASFSSPQLRTLRWCVQILYPQREHCFNTEPGHVWSIVNSVQSTSSLSTRSGCHRAALMTTRTRARQKNSRRTRATPLGKRRLPCSSRQRPSVRYSHQARKAAQTGTLSGRRVSADAPTSGSTLRRSRSS